MKPFSFVHAADLHLDTPFTGISSASREVSLRLRQATFDAYENIINLCLNRGVDFLVVAGDVYDSADKSLQAQLRFQQGLLRLSKAGIRAYVAHGNHDPLDRWSASLVWPDNVHIFGGKAVERVVHKKDKNAVAALYGISFAARDIFDNLAGIFPAASKSDSNLVKIGVLHCNVGKSTGHEPYAPCSIGDLASKEFDYWALGHVHTRAVIRDGDLLAVYPGNPQGLSPSETGERGCYLVSVDEDCFPQIEFVATDSIRWFKRDVSIKDMSSLEDLMVALRRVVDEVRSQAEERSAILRITLCGRSPLHEEIMRDGVLDDIVQNIRETEEDEKNFVWLERITDRTSLPVDRNNIMERQDFVGDLVNLFEEIYQSRTLRQEVGAVYEELFTSPMGRKMLQPYSDNEIIELLHKAESILLDRMVKG